jgi:hypothetical protein
VEIGIVLIPMMLDEGSIMYALIIYVRRDDVPRRIRIRPA